jgi:hypothetical protein
MCFNYLSNLDGGLSFTAIIAMDGHENGCETNRPLVHASPICYRDVQTDTYATRMFCDHGFTKPTRRCRHRQPETALLAKHCQSAVQSLEPVDFDIEYHSSVLPYMSQSPHHAQEIPSLRHYVITCRCWNPPNRRRMPADRSKRAKRCFTAHTPHLPYTLAIAQALYTT